MPKCQKCGLEVRRGAGGDWQHVDAGTFTHSAAPVDLRVSLPARRPFPPKIVPPDKTRPQGGKFKKKAKLSTPVYLERKREKKGRLPHGALFSLEYNGLTQTWTGALAVPNYPPVSAVHEGVFRLLERLDDQFRELAKGADSPHNKSVDGEVKTG